MKKTRINLLSYQNDYINYEKYFRWIRSSAVVFSIVFFIILFISLTFIATQFRSISNLNNSKTELLNILTQREEERANIMLINKKYQAMQTYLKDDAKSLPYYQLLSTAIKTSTESGNLQSFTINKDRESSFSVAFQNFSELMSFFRFVESEVFLRNFEKVSLKSFNAIQNDKSLKNKDKYELSFQGIFIPIDQQ